MFLLNPDSVDYMHTSIKSEIDNFQVLCPFAARFVSNRNSELYDFFMGYTFGDFETSFFKIENRKMNLMAYKEAMLIIEDKRTAMRCNLRKTSRAKKGQRNKGIAIVPRKP